jgi:hypothetical protein
MELFEEIRRGRAAGETIQGLATKHRVYRRTVRQANRGEENPTWIPPRGDQPSHRIPFALGVHQRILYFGQRQRKRWDGRRGGSLQAELAGTCAGGERSGLAERTATGRAASPAATGPSAEGTCRWAKPVKWSDSHLQPLAEERFPIDEILFPLVVEGHGRVKVKTNWYSTPLWPGLRVKARVWPSRVEIEHEGECVARHQRCYGCGHQILNLEHYLDVLEKKPGAMAGSTPLEQWRQAGRWPEWLPCRLQCGKPFPRQCDFIRNG